MKYTNTIITGTGSYIPSQIIKNSHFLKQIFFEKDKTKLEDAPQTIVNKFKDITGISERRWAKNDQTTSTLATIAAQEAIKDANIDPETIDHIIIAQNFGDINIDSHQTDLLPSIASRVKHNLGIQNPFCIPYDIIFGCPGWLQALIQADAYIKESIAKRCLVNGAETLSRVIDVYDRDSMIFSDGAGAAIVEGIESNERKGILSTAVMSHTNEEASYLFLGKTNQPNNNSDTKYMKMHGRKIYEYSLLHVPGAMKKALDKTDVPIEKIKKIIIHQANEKMDEAIVQRFFRQYNIRQNIASIMPMSIHELGNSSVATIPTLYDMILKNKIPNHSIEEEDYIIFASVGAGMNINAVVYKQ